MKNPIIDKMMADLKDRSEAIRCATMLPQNPLTSYHSGQLLQQAMQANVNSASRILQAAMSGSCRAVRDVTDAEPEAHPRAQPLQEDILDGEFEEIPMPINRRLEG